MKTEDLFGKVIYQKGPLKTKDFFGKFIYQKAKELSMNKLVSINPATLQILGEVSNSNLEDIQQKVAQAHQIKNYWKSLGVSKRIDLLRPLVKAFDARQQEIAQLTTAEMGKTINESINGLVWDFDYFNDFLNKGREYLADDITFQEDNIQDRVVFEPRGVVGCIVPWNYPFSNFLYAVIPNLIAGNPVVFKHSEECLLLGKLCEEVMMQSDLPPGVFSAIHGDQEVGESLIAQDIDMIWFIGSSSVGQKLYESAGKKQIKAILEMGGSNPTIVFDDVNIDSIIPSLIQARFSNCGQSCDALKRLIVHKNVAEEVITKMVHHLQTLKIGDPTQPTTQMGPLVAMRQLTLLESQVADAVNKGAKILTGGKKPEGLTGAYYLPTLLTNITPDMRVWTEEVFGPVLPIVSFETEEEALKLANDTAYGLGAHIYSADIERAERMAAKIDAGSIDINQGSRWRPCNPFGGFKKSGMGCEHGKLGFQELCRFKVIARG